MLPFSADPRPTYLQDFRAERLKLFLKTVILRSLRLVKVNANERV